MRAFFDTSVLLPVFLEDHQHHEPSLRVFLRADKRTGFCGAHTLAEFYSSATRLPGKHRLSGEQALLFLENVVERLTVIALTADEYYKGLRTAAGAGILGGATYDAMLACCAIKASADVLYSWNERHFRQFPGLAAPVRTPK
jgi:predicted nucleic acid-binding protein